MVSRPPGRPLVTVSNHRSTLDDPTVLSAMMPLSLFFTESRHGRMRWTLCANDMCHINKLLCNFFLSGKTLPIVRGAGHHQPVLDLVARQLRDRGDWLHVFPEGRVRQDGQMNPLKSGLASILCDVADKGPIVVPFHHSGMQDVIRAHTARPRVNNRIRIAVGEPIPLEDLLAKCRKVCPPSGVRLCPSAQPCLTRRCGARMSCSQKGVDQRQLARDIMERVASSLEELRRLNAEAAQRGD